MTWASSVPILVFLQASVVNIQNGDITKCQNVDILPMSSFNVITVVVFHLRNKNTLRQMPFM